MASRYQKRCLRLQNRKEGRVWVLRYNGVRPEDGKRIERTPLFVGLAKDFPTKSHARREVDRQHVTEAIAHTAKKPVAATPKMGLGGDGNPADNIRGSPRSRRRTSNG